MQDEGPVYRHSGEIGSGRLVVPLISALVVLPLTLAYGHALVWLPGWLAPVLLLLLALGAGLLTSASAGPAKCRNEAFMTRAGLRVGIFTVYAGWVFFTFAWERRHGDSEIGWTDLPRLFVWPAEVWELMVRISRDGGSTFLGWTPAAPIVWIFWAVEAAVIVGLVWGLFSVAVSGEVFCEACDTWTEDAGPLYLEATDDETTLARLQAGDVDVLVELPSAVGEDGDEPDQRFAVKIKECPNCRETAAYQVVRETFAWGPGSRRVPKELTPFLLLTEDARERLRSVALRRGLS